MERALVGSYVIVVRHGWNRGVVLLDVDHAPRFASGAYGLSSKRYRRSVEHNVQRSSG